MLYGYVSRRVGAERLLAEDIVQETWLRAVQSWRTKGIPNQPGAWLVRVARNLLMSHFRRRRRHTVNDTELEIAGNQVAAEGIPAAALVNWGLSKLKRHQANLIEEFHFEGKSIRDMAVLHGLSERAVEGRLRRARENLRSVLEPFVRPGTRLAAGPKSATIPLQAVEHIEEERENAR